MNEGDHDIAADQRHRDVLDELLAVRAVLARLEQLMDKIALSLGIAP